MTKYATHSTVQQHVFNCLKRQSEKKVKRTRNQIVAASHNKQQEKDTQNQNRQCFLRSFVEKKREREPSKTDLMATQKQ